MLRILLVVTLLLLLSAGSARAALCSVDVGDLDFGQVDSIGNAPALSSAVISIDCDAVTEGVDKITLCGNFGEGSGGAAGSIRRAMSGGDMLGFVLSATDGGSVPWGSTETFGLGAPQPIEVPVDSGSGSASGIAHLYGVVPAGQSEAAIGEYRADFNETDSFFTYAEGDLDCDTPVGGADVSAPFSVLASVTANCLIETANLNFGSTGRIDTAIDADAPLNITCTAGTDYTIAIDGGGAEDPEHRLMSSGSNSLRYDLDSNAQHTLAWGTDEGSTVSAAGTGNEVTLGVYGRIPPQPAAPGAYTDTVVVTISY